MADTYTLLLLPGRFCVLRVCCWATLKHMQGDFTGFCQLCNELSQIHEIWVPKRTDFLCNYSWLELITASPSSQSNSGKDGKTFSRRSMTYLPPPTSQDRGRPDRDWIWEETKKTWLTQYTDKFICLKSGDLGTLVEDKTDRVSQGHLHSAVISVLRNFKFLKFPVERSITTYFKNLIPY